MGSRASKDTEIPKNSAQQADGLRSIKTTGVFKALNFELYVKPNKFIMAFGIIAISGCAGYLAYMKTKYENMGYYVAIREDGTQQLHNKKSRWD